MEQKRDRTVTIAVITGVVTLLLGLCLGASAGGLAGYFIGRQVGQNVIEQLPEPGVVPEMPERMLPGMMGRSGALVSEVLSDSPAEQAGLQPLDLIIRVDNIPIDANHRLADVLAQYRPGDRVELEVWRFGETRTVQVTLDSNPENQRRAYLGIRYVDLSAEPEVPGD